MKKTFIIAAALISIAAISAAPAASAAKTATDDKAQSYIAKYSTIAVEEMYRSGVPASITLAQGMLESGYGYGTLATKGNNHFGIKCHADWSGPTIRHDDDRKAECFRKYSSAQDSFRDHSDYLRYKERYQSLFDYDVLDYKSWAYGLKKAGYATNPQYAERLIELIERYDLSRYDRVQAKAKVKGKSAGKGKGAGKTAADAEDGKAVPESPSQLARPRRFTGSGNAGTFAVSLEREVMQVNGVPFIYARAGESFESIARLYNLFPKELMRYNEVGFDTRIRAGQVIYLQRKKSCAAKGLQKHVCSEGESLYDISQKYAIRLKSLMQMNGFSDAYHELKEDDSILLQKPSRGRQSGK